jgi:hypothetical protein
MTLGLPLKFTISGEWYSLNAFERVTNNNFATREGKIDTHRKNISFVAMVVRSFDGHAATSDLLTKESEFSRLFRGRFFRLPPTASCCGAKQVMMFS